MEAAQRGNSAQTEPGLRDVATEDATGISLLLRRFFPFYCVLAALITFGYALYDTYQLDGDAVAYMDIGDYLRAHQWGGVVNSYWHPMYPAFLSLGHILFHATLATEMRAYYLVNYGIFVLGMIAVVAFTDALAALRATSQRVDDLFGRYALRYLGLALVVIASQRELSLGKVRPDALLQAFFLFAMAALLRNLVTGRVRYAALMGLALGCAYLTKSFALVFALACIVALISFRWLWLRNKPVPVIASAVVALICFGAIAGPYMAALSRQHGRLDFGDSGALNYAWYVGGTEKMHIQPYMTAEFGPAEVHLKHPERELMRNPQVLSYAALPYGTYPDWFDPTYWNDQVKPHFALAGEIRRGSRNCVLVVRYLLNHPEGLILLALLLVLGARARFEWKPGANTFWIPPVLLGVAVWGIYGTVNTEERYVTVAYFTIILTVFAMLRAADSKGVNARFAAGMLVVFFALLAVGESLRIVLEDRRDLSAIGTVYGWRSPKMIDAARALNSMGIGRGDSVACEGSVACLSDPYWARLAQVRILDEVYDPLASPAWEFLNGLPNRDEVVAVVKAQGARVLVADFGGAPLAETSLVAEGWKQLGDSTLYELPLNVPPGTEPAKMPPPIRHKPPI